MSLADQLDRTFPDLALIRQQALRRGVSDFWAYVGERNPLHKEIEALPNHPTLPIERHGNLAAHKRAIGAMVRAVVPTYAREWGIELDLDHFLVAAFTHDAAKVVEFVQGEDGLVATPGFNHAVEGGRIALAVGLPGEIAHMIAAHMYVGPMLVPRTRAAQIFSFLDPLCLPVFPEHGKSSVQRHLEANGWTAPEPPADAP